MLEALEDRTIDSDATSLKRRGAKSIFKISEVKRLLPI